MRWAWSEGGAQLFDLGPRLGAIEEAPSEGVITVNKGGNPGMGQTKPSL